MPKIEKLTPKQQAFVDEYLVSFNMTLAYLKAYDVGSDTKRATINKKAYEVYNHPKVKEAIKEALQIVLDQKENLVAKMITTCLEIIDSTDSKPNERVKAMEMLAKLIGVSEKHDVNSNVETMFNISIVGVERENDG